MSAALLVDARAVTPDGALARHGKTFHWASRLLGPRQAADTRAVYAFCRYVDDLADVLGGEAGRRRLAAVRHDLDRGVSAHPAVAPFLAFARRAGLDPAVAPVLVGAAERDLEPSTLADEAELVDFAYRMAGTVGVMMCALLGVRDARALPFAVDLGVAMQLTNVARDVVEDARRGRVYLPAAWLGGPLPAEAIAADRGDACARAFAAVGRTLDLAERYYRSADRGLRFLPLRARAAVATAARCYEAIGARVRARGVRGLGGRAFTTRCAKARLTAGALARLALRPAFWDVGRAPRHDPTLHAPLRGLPGADPRAGGDVRRAGRAAGPVVLAEA